MPAVPKHTLYTQHARTWRDNHYVYPVVSRRSKGLSIGINLNPDQACNFDCVYCSVDRTKPPTNTDVDPATVADELRGLLELARTGDIWKQPPFDGAPAALRRLNDIAFSGDGEPTSSPHFPDICRIVANTIEQSATAPAPKIVLITNATLLHRPRVIDALDFLDAHHGEVWAKLDAGTEAYYRRIERTAVPFERVLENILHTGQKRPIVIQSLFMLVDNAPPTDGEISAYASRLRDLIDGACHIKQVQIYTIARDTAERFVTPLPDPHLDAIATKVAGLGLPVETFYGPQ